MQRVALALSQVIPSPALGLLLDANLSSVHIHEGLDSVTALVAGKGCGLNMSWTLIIVGKACCVTWRSKESPMESEPALWM